MSGLAFIRGINIRPLAPLYTLGLAFIRDININPVRIGAFWCLLVLIPCVPINNCQPCWNESSWVEPVLSSRYSVLLNDIVTPQKVRLELATLQDSV